MCNISVDYEVLVDESRSGKYRPWKEKKISNVHYYELLEILQFKKAERVRMCAEVLEFKLDVETGEKALHKAWFCKSRLCPVCNWRRSMKQSTQAVKIVQEVMRLQPTTRWIFLTLSVKNVYDGRELNKSISAIHVGFNRLMKYKKVAKNVIGYMRATEVTVNESDFTYNQHIHVLIAVKPTYFKSDDNYINQDEWRNLWKKAMKLDYKPYVHVTVVKPKGKYNNDGIKGALKEVAKYPVKDVEYLTNDEYESLQRVYDLEKGLQGKRLLSYGGLLKEVHKKLSLDDVDDGDLIHVDDDSSNEIKEAYTIIARWNWQRQNYYIVNRT